MHQETQEPSPEVHGAKGTSKATPTGGTATRISVRAGGKPSRSTPTTMFRLNTAQMYTLLAFAHASLAIPLLFFPHASSKLVFGRSADPVDKQHASLLQLYASGLSTSTSMLLALEELARGGLLHTLTADLLKMGLIGHSIASLTLLATYFRTICINWVVVEGLAAIATFALPASSLLTTPTNRARIWSTLRTIPNLAMGAFLRPQQRRFSWLALMYNTLMANVLVAGLSYIFAPRWSLYHAFGYDYGKSAHYMWSLIGSGALLTLVPATLMALKHKADTQRMAATPARTLNVGLMGTAIGHMLVLGPWMFKGWNAGALLPGLVGSWGGVLVTSMLGLAAPEVQHMAEEVVEAATATGRGEKME